MVARYTLHAGTGRPSDFCRAKIVGWTDEYEAKIIWEGNSAENQVTITRNSYTKARCLMNLRSDGTMDPAQYTERHAELCRLFLKKERNRTPYYLTMRAVDVKLSLPEGEKIWSMYNTPVPRYEDYDSLKHGWRIFEVDKNLCMPYNPRVSFEAVAKSITPSMSGFFIDRFTPEWLLLYWTKIGTLEFKPEENGYDLGDDFHNPMGKWYYTIDSPYHKKLH